MIAHVYSARRVRIHEKECPLKSLRVRLMLSDILPAHDHLNSVE
jgi:hypothetical protein